MNRVSRIHKNSLFVLYSLSLILAYLCSISNAEAAQLSYFFNPMTQGYELYGNNDLLLWGTGDSGFEPLKAPSSKWDKKTISVWLGMIMAAQAMQKTLKVTYDSETGIIISVQGPK